MTAFDYPVELMPDDGVVLAVFPDLSGATFGVDEADALTRAADLLETALQGLIADRAELPSPSPPDGRRTVRPSLLGTLKLSLYQAMQERGWRRADLARALGVDQRQVDRLLNLNHRSTLQQLESALAACGQRAEVSITTLAA